MGPLNNQRQLKVVQDMIEQARLQGASVQELGVIPDMRGYREGYFQRPTLVLGPSHSLDVVREEQFGPVLPIMPFETEEQGIGFANDSRFALCSSVWSRPSLIGSMRRSTACSRQHRSLQVSEPREQSGGTVNVTAPSSRREGSRNRATHRERLTA